MSRTTKGPWTTDGVYSERDGCWWVYGGDCTPVAQVLSYGGDACLIAAAPDLLRALEGLVRAVCDEDKTLEMGLKTAVAAVAKATGGKP